MLLAELQVTSRLPDYESGQSFFTSCSGRIHVWAI